MGRRILLCVLLVGLLIGPAMIMNGWPVSAIQNVLDRGDKSRVFENFDVRETASVEVDQKLTNRRNRQSPQQRARNQGLGQSMRTARDLMAKSIPGLRVAFGRTLDSPEVVTVEPGRGRFLTGPSSQHPENVVRSFITQNATLYGLNSSQLSKLKKTADYSNPAGNISWVTFQQRVNNLPVFRGELTAAVSGRGELLRTTGQFPAGLEESTLPSSPTYGAAQAVAIGAASIGITLNAADLVQKEISPDGTIVTFEPGPFDEDIRVELQYFPLENGLAALSWSMVLWQANPAYYTIVDAEIGELLWRKNITEDQTQSATYSVYNSDSPAPLSPTTAFPGSGIQGTITPRTLFTLISEGTAFNNLGWITDGGTTTTGNNVDAGLDVLSPNGIDSNGRPVSPTRNFNFAYNPAPGNPAPGESPALSNYRFGEVVNMFFWSNRYHDQLYQLGFTEPARNFQTNNFGRGGLGNDFVRAEAQDFSGTNNANFSTPADGQLPRMQMYIFSGPTPNRTSGLDQEILIHELTHGTSNRLHNNASGLSAVISRGMGEGWSDFYALALLSESTDDPTAIYGMGGYSTFGIVAGYTDNYYYGIRRFPYAVKTNTGPNGRPHNPLTLADVDPNRIDLTDGAYSRGPIGLGGRVGATAVHNIGEVWCMALWEVRARIINRLGHVAGNQRILQIVTDAMKLDPVNPTLLDGRDALLLAASTFGQDDVLDVWAGFAARGMGFGSSIISTVNHNVVETSDNPIPGVGAVSVTDDGCNGNGVPDVGENVILTVPLTNPLSSTMTGVTASVVGGGSASYGTIASGATVTRTLTYRVPSNVACGAEASVSVQVTSNLGVELKTIKFRTGSPVTGYQERFDSVTAPALPAGWATATSGAQPLWVTSTAASDTPPNAASTTFAASTGLNELVSPSIAIASPYTQLTFRHSYNSEFNWDGGVLEISIGGGAYADILDAGGTFETGGYPFTLLRASENNTNPLQARAAWTGNSGGFITTTVNLPQSAAGQSIRLRFRAGSDSAFTVTGSHWRIDTLVIRSFTCATVGTATVAAAAAGQYSDSVNLSATVSSACAGVAGSVEFKVNGVPAGTAPVNSSGVATLAYTITQAAGSYPISAVFTSSSPYFNGSTGSNTLTVSRENAVVTPSATNPDQVRVNSAGGTAGPITLCANINEVSDGSPGNIGLAVPVTIVLSPVGPGSGLSGTATVVGGGVGGTLNACATFNNVNVNVYEVAINVGGNYYAGSGSTVLAVFDPSLGFVTGGGTVIRNGVPANFGFNVKYLKNGNAQGSLLYIEHRPTGIVKLKSNSMQSLSIAGNTGIIISKATLNDVGNYNFRATVVDNGEPGVSDQFGLLVTAPGGAIVTDLTFNPITINKGNIQVPHVTAAN